MQSDRISELRERDKNMLHNSVRAAKRDEGFGNTRDETDAV